MKAVSSNRGTPLAGGPNQRGRWGGFHAFGEVGVRSVEWMMRRVRVVNGCWEWTGSTNGCGYGRLYANPPSRKSTAAHRVMYEMVRGEIPNGLTLDHLCRNRLCINPQHLEPVTNRENVLRGIGISAHNKRKTHCCRGHELSGHNLIPNSNDGRDCRTCKVARNRECRRLAAAIRALAKEERK